MKHHAHGQDQGAFAGMGAKLAGARELGEMKSIRPMDAVVALYSEGDHELAEAIIASLSHAVFDGGHPGPAGPARRAFARISYRILKWTTTRRKATDEDYEGGAFHNPILKWCGHPYVRALLDSSSRETEVLVEGGDAMNGPYMMIAPEILRIANTWDRVFLNSVQSRDVQLRFIWETQAICEAARFQLENGGAVRMKAIAAGTGLSMILAYDRLMREGHDPARINLKITDRDKTQINKCQRLLDKLTSTRAGASEGRISAETEDVFEAEPGTATFDIIIAVGIFEYLPGFTCDTTERRLGLPRPMETATGERLAATLARMTTDGGVLIVNSSRPDASARILELFGRRFDYRNKENLTALLATADFRTPRLVGSGNIYDVVVYKKNPA